MRHSGRTLLVPLLAAGLGWTLVAGPVPFAVGADEDTAQRIAVSGGGYPGALDPTFGKGGLSAPTATVRGFFWALGRDDNGRIVAGGSQLGMVASLQRISGRGRLDPTYGTDGVAFVNAGQGVQSQLVSDNGAVTELTYFQGLSRLIRLRPDGTQRMDYGCPAGEKCQGYTAVGFGVNGIPRSLLALPHGKVLAVVRGEENERFQLFRLDRRGVVDKQYRTTPGWSEAAALGRSGDGRRVVYVIGSVGAPGDPSTRQLKVARYTLDGKLDRTFGCDSDSGCPGYLLLPGGAITDQTSDAGIVVDGNRVSAVGTTGQQGSARVAGWLLDRDGVRIRRYQRGPTMDLITEAAVLLDRKGRLVVGGASSLDPGSRALLTRWGTDRRLDEDFGCPQAGACSGTADLLAGSASTIIAGPRGTYLAAGNNLDTDRAVVFRVLAD